jgi:hypothetical protein
MASSPMPTGPPISHWPAGSSAHPTPVERRERRHRKSSRRPRVERLSLLRRAYDHHRDLRTRLPAAAVPDPIDRARQLMTSMLLSPSHIAEPVPGRYLIGDGYPPPTATVRAPSIAKNAERSLQDHRSDPAHGDETQGRGDYSPVVPVRNRKIRACTGAKSP